MLAHQYNLKINFLWLSTTSYQLVLPIKQPTIMVQLIWYIFKAKVLFLSNITDWYWVQNNNGIDIDRVLTKYCSHF